MHNFPMVAKTLAQNVKFLMERHRTNPNAVAAVTRIPQPTIHRILTGETKDPRGRTLQLLASHFGVTMSELLDKRLRDSFDLPASDVALVGPGATPRQSEMIEVEHLTGGVQGSCGGGRFQVEDLARKREFVPRSWLVEKGLNADDLIAVAADGDSMADFIVDGDMVIFDRSKTRVHAGKIYLLEFPDGVRIHSLRKQLDGSLLCSSMNPDKRRFPEYTLTASDMDRVKIVGEFVRRSGGW